MYGYLLGTDTVLLWNAKDVSDLRLSHRVVGHFVGSMPNDARQNNEFGLPLVLMPEETKLLIELGILRLRDISVLIQSLTQREIDQLRTLTAAYDQSSVVAMDAPLVVANEPGSTSTNTNTPSSLISINTKLPMETLRTILQDGDNTAESSDIPYTSNSTTSSFNISSNIVDRERNSDVTHTWVWPTTREQITRYNIFKDLWYKRHYLTSGLKFGGDYLVYEHDPLTCHASFIAKIVSWDEVLPINQLVTAGRLGGKVKKQTVLCSINPVGGTVKYMTLSWTDARWYE